MEKFLNNLRKKPRAYRQSVALGVSAAVTAIIFLAWVGSFIFGANPIQNSSGSDASQNVAASETPFGVLKEQFGQITADMSAKFGGQATISTDMTATVSTSSDAASSDNVSSTSSNI